MIAHTVVRTKLFLVDKKQLFETGKIVREDMINIVVISVSAELKNWNYISGENANSQMAEQCRVSFA